MVRKLVLGGLAAVAFASAAGAALAGSAAAAAGTAPQAAAAMTLTSPAFEQGALIPKDYAGDGKNTSPPLAWDRVPEGTVSFALIMEDPDARMGPYIHWLICDLSGTTRMVPEGLPKEDTLTRPVSAVQGTNSAKGVGYTGPRPPKGENHRYFFRLYALDERLDIPGSFSKKQLEAAMKDHILAQATLMGRYGR